MDWRCPGCKAINTVADVRKKPGETDLDRIKRAVDRMVQDHSRKSPTCHAMPRVHYMSPDAVFDMV